MPGFFTGPRLVILLIACSGVAPLLNAQNRKELATSDTHLEVTAGPTAPQVSSVRGRDGAVWNNGTPEHLPAYVEADGARIPLVWRFQQATGGTEPIRVTFVYETSEPHLRLTWEWDARAAFGPLEHHVTIENLSSRELWLPIIASLQMDWKVASSIPLQHLFIEKGAGSPSPVGTHRVNVAPGYRWTGWSSTYALPLPDGGREIIPFEIITQQDAAQTGWYAGIEFSGRTRITLDRTESDLSSLLGLNPDPGPAVTRLVPGGSFETPTVFLGTYAGGPDGVGNQLRPWVRAVLNSPGTWRDPKYPLLVNNSWGSGMQVDEALAKQMIANSAALGLEMFHLDAGWFRGVGDWYPDPKKFPHGLAVLADDAHSHGLRFGLWVDWTQAALDTEPGALNVRDPKVRDWLVADVPPGWKPEEFKGQTIDIGVPAARDYAGREVKRIVEDYHLDMLEHDGYLVPQGCTRDDHPHAPPDRSHMTVTHTYGGDFVFSSNSTDVSYHAVRSYYAIYEQLRREHPGLLLEICNDGGRMVDFGSAAHGDYFSITDTYDPLSNRRAFYDTSFALPPAMLESYIEKWPTPNLANFLYMLRSGMMGWTTIMQDTNAWTAEQQSTARQAFQLYKSSLRPLIRDAELFHISDRPDGIHWDGMEYWDPARKKGVVFAFHGTDPSEPEHRFRVEGLQPQKQYSLHFQDGSSTDSVLGGQELMSIGLSVHLPLPQSSELIFIEER